MSRNCFRHRTGSGSACRIQPSWQRGRRPARHCSSRGADRRSLRHPDPSCGLSCGACGYLHRLEHRRRDAPHGALRPVPPGWVVLAVAAVQTGTRRPRFAPAGPASSARRPAAPSPCRNKRESVRHAPCSRRIAVPCLRSPAQTATRRASRQAGARSARRLSATAAAATVRLPRRVRRRRPSEPRSQSPTAAAAQPSCPGRVVSVP